MSIKNFISPLPSTLPSFLPSFHPFILSSVRPLIEGILLQSVKLDIRNDPEAVSLTSNSQSPLRSMRRSIDKRTRGNNIHFNCSTLQKPESSVSRTDRIAKLSTNYTDWIILEQMWSSWRGDEPQNSNPKHSINSHLNF